MLFGNVIQGGSVERLTLEERGRMAKGFLMVAGGIALAMVLFALIHQLLLTTIVLVVVGFGMVSLVPLILLLCKQPARVIYGTMATGLGVVAGAVGGNLLVQLVIAAFF